jgi:SH3-like domain-containing protein
VSFATLVPTRSLRPWSATLRILTIIAALILPLGLAQAVEDALPLPRFVSLRSDTVNVRSGPGVRYPIEWVFTKRSMPVEVLEEFEVWRKIRDWQGTEGWVHQTNLSGKRSAIVTGDVRDLRRDGDPRASVIARIEPGVVGQLLDCHGTWCRVEFDGQKGYLAKSEFWGAYPNETVN